jgi:fatty acid desaturase
VTKTNGADEMQDIWFCDDGNTSEVITRRQLPQETRKIVRALHDLSPGWNWVILLHLGIWLVCAYIAISVEILILDLLLYTVAGVSLTTLSVLCHEASHNLFTRRSSRDAWLGALCGFPILFSSAGYRVMHRYHHKYLRTKLDPDDPENITNHPRLMPFLFIVMMLLGVYLYIVTVPLNALRHGNGHQRVTIIAELAAMISATVAAWTFIPTPYMLEGWLYPLLIGAQLTNLRGLTEHVLVSRGNEFGDARTITTNRWLASMMCNINYHLEHHLFPGMPWYNLPKVHKALSGMYERTGASVYPTYRSFYKDFFMAMRQEYVSGRRLVPAHIREHICV